MKKLFTTIAGFLFASCAAAQQELIDFQNFGGSALTVKSAIATSKLFFKVDGTYVLTLPGKVMRNDDWDSRGVWRMEGHSICSTVTEPLPAQQFLRENCQNIPVNNYGESWVIESNANGEIHVTINREDTDL